MASEPVLNLNLCPFQTSTEGTSSFLTFSSLLLNWKRAAYTTATKIIFKFTLTARQLTWALHLSLWCHLATLTKRFVFLTNGNQWLLKFTSFLLLLLKLGAYSSPTSWVISCDSKPALAVINYRPIRSRVAWLVSEIARELYAAIINKHSVALRRTQGHVDIVGNENADKLATAAHRDGNLELQP